MEENTAIFNFSILSSFICILLCIVQPFAVSFSAPPILLVVSKHTISYLFIQTLLILPWSDHRTSRSNKRTLNKSLIFPSILKQLRFLSRCIIWFAFFARYVTVSNSFRWIPVMGQAEKKPNAALEVSALWGPLAQQRHLHPSVHPTHQSKWDRK